MEVQHFFMAETANCPVSIEFENEDENSDLSVSAKLEQLESKVSDFQQYALEAEEIAAKHRESQRYCISIRSSRDANSYEILRIIANVAMVLEQNEIAENNLKNEALKLREEISALEKKYNCVKDEISGTVAEQEETVIRRKG